MSFKDFSIFSPGGHFVQMGRLYLLAIMVEGLSANICVKLF